ncbi:MAG TPA: energy transducer TonB [Bacteroidia bacterium]|jgi:TonB family protein|nr:energy transducer TonB [Bacteroidia bacterium]
MFKNRFRIFYTLLLLIVMVPAVSKAQDTLSKPPITQPRHHLPGLPLVPQYPGGKDSLKAFLKKNTHYPSAARKNHISGTIEVDFWVDTLGNLSQLKVLKPLGYGCDKEALRVVKKMPRWKPGMDSRKPMAMDYHVDVIFGEPQKK